MNSTLTINPYDRVLSDLDQVQVISDSIKNELSNINIDNIKVESNIDVYDFRFASIFGILGVTISSSEAIEKFNHKIHDIASDNKVKDANALQSLLGKILKHNGDIIDTTILNDGSMKKGFINREGSVCGPFMHRLLRGHDPLSIKGDNPFKLLCSQYGFFNGIVQVFQHLKNLSKQSPKADLRSVYEGIFTIHAQDILSQGAVWALCKAYFRFRNVKDDTRMRQIKIIAYSVNFFTHVGVGMGRQGGIPYIHWPALSMLTKELAGIYISSYKEIAVLEKKTEQLVASNEQLEARVFETGRNIITYDNAAHYFEQIEKEKNMFNNLTNFFEEE